MMIRQGLLWATILGICAWIQAQQTAQLDFFADAGAFESDYNKDGREDYIADFVEGGVQWGHLSFSLDNQVKYAGVASQRIQLQRASGGSGRYAMFKRLNFSMFLKPDLGEPLLVRLALRAQGFNNASYRVFIITGNRQINLVSSSRQDTNGWQLVSTVAPVEQNSSGNPNFEVWIEIGVSEGAASGTLWIDELQALSMRTVARPDSLPNGLKIAIINHQHDPYQDLTDLPARIIVGSRNIIPVFRRHYPNTIVAPYVLFGGTIISPANRHNSDLYNYDDVVQNHLEWFLPNASGQPIQRDIYFMVDVGIPEVRERAWQSLRDFMLRAGRPRYVFFDDVDMRVGRNSPRYNNDIENWARAVAGALTYIGSRLQNELGASIIPNTAWSPGYWLRGINGPDAPGVPTLPYMGGFLIEHAFTHARTSQGQTTISAYGPLSVVNNWIHWTLRNEIRLATEYPDKIVILMPTYIPNLPDARQKVRFAVAGSLIVQHENTYLKIEPRGGSGSYPEGFYPPELFVPLGRWTENYRILNGDIVSGGLFVRNYENGVVVWNPTDNRDFTFTVPHDLYDWDRNLIRAGTVVNIPRQTGHVFYSAPEITLELSPQNVQVLPGQTVQFTVTYRNRGVAPGTNVRVAVPLPQGMTLIGSNPAARLENGQLVWIIPSVPVGGQGTLQFTVRVE